MLPFHSGASRSTSRIPDRGLAVSLAAVLALSFAPDPSVASNQTPPRASREIITLTAGAVADYVTPQERRRQLLSGAETTPRSRSAESKSSGTPQPHYVTYDFGYGWRYKMTNDTHQMVVQHEHLLERLGSFEGGLDGRFKRFMAMDEDAEIGADGYRVVTREEARAALHEAEVRYKLEVLGMNLPAHERNLGPTPPPGQGNSPNYALYRGRQSANAGVPMDAGSGLMPQAQAEPAPAVTVRPVAPAPAERHAVAEGAERAAAREAAITTPRVSRTPPPVVTFPKLETTEPVATVPARTASLGRQPQPPAAAAAVASPERPASAVNMDASGVVTVGAGEPTIAREVFEVRDIEPPMEGERRSGPVHRATIPKEEPVRRATLPETEAVGRAAVPSPDPSPAVVSIPAAPAPRPSRSRAALDADRALPPVPSPPPPPPGFIEPGRKAPAPAARRPAVRAGRPATLPVSENADRLTIPVPMGEPQVWGEDAGTSEEIAAAETRKASAKAGATKVPTPMRASDEEARIVHSDPDVPPARVVQAVDGGPEPPPEYRTKHGDRERVAPVFHTPSDDLWQRVGASNGNQALSAH